MGQTQKPMTSSSILLKFFTLIMHFQWEDPNNTVNRSKVENATTTTDYFAPKTKMGIN